MRCFSEHCVLWSAVSISQTIPPTKQAFFLPKKIKLWPQEAMHKEVFQSATSPAKSTNKLCWRQHLKGPVWLTTSRIITTSIWQLFKSLTQGHQSVLLQEKRLERSHTFNIPAAELTSCLCQTAQEHQFRPILLFSLYLSPYYFIQGASGPTHKTQWLSSSLPGLLVHLAWKRGSSSVLHSFQFRETTLALKNLWDLLLLPEGNSIYKITQAHTSQSYHWF